MIRIKQYQFYFMQGQIFNHQGQSSSQSTQLNQNVTFKSATVNSPIATKDPLFARYMPKLENQKTQTILDFQMASSIKNPPQNWQNLFLIQENHYPRNQNMPQSPISSNQQMRSQSPQESNGPQRGRQLGIKRNGKKKGVIVLKKESINRQNSFSKSPDNAIPCLNNSLGSPYHSPKTSEIEKYKVKVMKVMNGGQSQDLNEDTGTSVKNSVIVRKTVGELKRAQLHPFYFDTNLIKSCGPFNEQNGKHLSFGGLREGRNFAHFEQHYNQQSSEEQKYRVLDTAFNEGIPRKSQPIPINQDFLVQKFDQNQLQRERILRGSLDQSSESDDIFERQSSNALSVENLNHKSGQKKLVISKDSVQFNKDTTKNFDFLKDNVHSLGSLTKSVTQLNRARISTKLDLDQLLDVNLMTTNQSQSPDGLRRQKSDNIISVRSFNKSSLNHERSQNHLQLHVNNKIDVPKVVKAVPNVINSEALQSPTTAYSTSKDSVNLIKPLLGQQMEESKQLLNKSRQSNIFQARRSQTTSIIKEEKKENSSPLKKSPFKRVEKKAEVSRISQSLLLDNYYSRSKERQNPDLNEAFVGKKRESPRDERNQSTQASSTKMSPDVQGQTRNILSEDSNSKDLLPQYLNYGRRSTLTYHINKLIEENNRCNSPVRVSQYLVDIDYLKTKVQEKLTSQSNDLERNQQLQTQEKQAVNDQIKMIQTSVSNSSSNNAIMSLSQANTSEKFKEIIDNLFVPTASAFKRKTKEKDFRRPTQNPVRRSKSQQRTNQVTQQRSDKKKQLIDEIAMRSQGRE